MNYETNWGGRRKGVFYETNLEDPDWGGAIGLGGALAAMTLFRSLLFGLRMADPLVIGAAMGIFLATGLLAACLPAHRAATVDPMSALREE